jgi:hypothetical protein
MELLPPEIRATLPPLYAQDGLALDAVVHAKIFAPWGRLAIFVLEWDGGDTLFTWCDLGFGGEYGYSSLSELEAVSGKFGLPLERDLYFEPKPLRVAIADHEAFS